LLYFRIPRAQKVHQNAKTQKAKEKKKNYGFRM